MTRTFVCLLAFFTGIAVLRAEDTHLKPAEPRHIAGGGRLDLKDYTVPGKTTVFDFYSEYCPDCKALAPHLDKLHRERKDIAVVEIDINRPEVRGRIDWKSPVARQYRIDSTPHLEVYGPNGELEASGDAADKLVQGWIGS